MATKTVIKKRGKKSIPLPIAEPEQPQSEIIFKNTKEKGDAYEIFIKHHLIDSGNYEWVYLWNETPLEHILKSKIYSDYETIINDDREIIKFNGFELNDYNKRFELNKLQDLGIDLVGLKKNGTYVIIQCKFYSDNIDKNSMAGFHTYFLDCIKTNPNIEGKAYITHELAPNLKKITRRNGIEYIIKEYVKNNLIENSNNSNNILNPRNYQLDAVNILKTKHRAILAMACGLGKTLVGILLSKLHDIIIVFSPLKEYVEQNKIKFEQQIGNDYKTLIIDCDYIRDSKIILEFIKNNKKCCLFITYKSCDIALEIIKKYPNTFVIIDEFHNLSYNDAVKYNSSIKNEQTNINKLIYNKNTKILFISATPRILGNETESDNIDIDENIFGKIEYSYSMGKAIKDKLISDYEIIVPSITLKQSNGISEILNMMTNKKYNENLIIKARFILKGIIETGSKKCIIYLQNQNEAKEFNNILRDVAFKYFAKYIYSDTIISDDSITSRRTKLKNFKETDDILCFICSVQIMNEAIDIPCCDSVFLANTTDNKIKAIQRISRATRLDILNPNKKAQIFVWCDDYNSDLANFISNIKEYDETFKFEDKIKRFNSTSWNNITLDKTVEKKEYENLHNVIIGIKSFPTYYERRDLIFNFTKANNARPNINSSNEYEKRLARHFNEYEKEFVSKKSIMKNQEIYDDFKKLKHSFGYILLSNKEIWHLKYERLLEFINENERMPKRTKFNADECEIADWITENNNQYPIKDRALSDQNIWQIWDKFMKDYDSLINKDYYEYIDEIKVYSEFCDKNKRCPLFENDVENELNKWYEKNNKQHENHKNNKAYQKEIDAWTAFKTKYNNLFEQRLLKIAEINNILKLKKDKAKIINANNKTKKLNKSIPINTIEKLITRINDIDKFYNKFEVIPEEKKDKLPNMSDEEFEHMKIFGKWIDGAKGSYNKNIGLMKTVDARKLFDKFIAKYNILTEEEEWLQSYEIILNKATNNEYPNSRKDSKLYNWIYNNKNKYDLNDGKGIINKYDGLREKFKILIDNYPNLFIDYEKLKNDIWNENYENLIKFIDNPLNIEKKLPSQYFNKDTELTNENKNEKALRQWYDDNNKYFKDSPENSLHRMKQQKYYDLWKQFKIDYSL